MHKQTNKKIIYILKNQKENQTNDCANVLPSRERKRKDEKLKNKNA